MLSPKSPHFELVPKRQGQASDFSELQKQRLFSPQSKQILTKSSTLSNLRKSIVKRTENENKCYNQPCLQVECAYLQSQNQIQQLQEELEKLKLKLIDNEGEIFALREEN